MRCFCGLLLFASLGSAALAGEPKPELLWPNGAPGATGDKPSDRPTITPFLADPKNAVGTAVVICPGGLRRHGRRLQGDRDRPMVQLLRRLGLRARSRHRGGGYGHPAPLQDAQRAIRTIRARAGQWHVDGDRIGIMGFSAGGHLASTAGTHFDRGQSAITRPDRAHRLPARFPGPLLRRHRVGEPYTNRGSRKTCWEKTPTRHWCEACQREAGDAADPAHVSFHRTGTKPCRRRTPYNFISPCAAPACRPSCTSTPPAPTASAWRKPRPALSSWPDRLKELDAGTGAASPPTRRARVPRTTPAAAPGVVGLP